MAGTLPLDDELLELLELLDELELEELLDELLEEELELELDELLEVDPPGACAPQAVKTLAANMANTVVCKYLTLYFFCPVKIWINQLISFIPFGPW